MLRIGCEFFQKKILIEANGNPAKRLAMYVGIAILAIGVAVAAKIHYPSLGKKENSKPIQEQ